MIQVRVTAPSATRTTITEMIANPIVMLDALIKLVTTQPGNVSHVLLDSGDRIVTYLAAVDVLQVDAIGILETVKIV